MKILGRGKVYMNGILVAEDAEVDVKFDAPPLADTVAERMLENGHDLNFEIQVTLGAVEIPGARDKYTKQTIEEIKEHLDKGDRRKPSLEVVDPDDDE